MSETTNYVAVQVDEENNAEAWWSALDATYPEFADSLRRNGVAVIAEPLWAELVNLPGFSDGPEFAPDALIHCGTNGGEQWAGVVGRWHNVFEELS